MRSERRDTDPYMAWRSISQSGVIIISGMYYGI